MRDRLYASLCARSVLKPLRTHILNGFILFSVIATCAIVFLTMINLGKNVVVLALLTGALCGSGIMYLCWDIRLTKLFNQSPLLFIQQQQAMAFDAEVARLVGDGMRLVDAQQLVQRRYDAHADAIRAAYEDIEGPLPASPMECLPPTGVPLVSGEFGMPHRPPPPPEPPRKRAMK